MYMYTYIVYCIHLHSICSINTSVIKSVFIPCPVPASGGTAGGAAGCESATVGVVAMEIPLERGCSSQSLCSSFQSWTSPSSENSRWTRIHTGREREIHVHIYMYLSIVCGGGKERERERGGEGGKEGGRERERQRETETERERDSGSLADLSFSISHQTCDWFAVPSPLPSFLPVYRYTHSYTVIAPHMQYTACNLYTYFLILFHAPLPQYCRSTHVQCSYSCSLFAGQWSP